MSSLNPQDRATDARDHAPATPGTTVGAADERATINEFALSLLRQNTLTDLTVPGGMGGRRTLEQLRRIDSEIHAVVMSGYSKDPVMAGFRGSGFRASLPKPFGLAELEAKLTEVRNPGDQEAAAEGAG